MRSTSRRSPSGPIARRCPAKTTAVTKTKSIRLRIVGRDLPMPGTSVGCGDVLDREASAYDEGGTGQPGQGAIPLVDEAPSPGEPYLPHPVDHQVPHGCPPRRPW